MKKLSLLILITVFWSCSYDQQSKNASEKDSIADNQELAEIYKNDQADRMTDDINWGEVMQRDRLRRARVTEMLDSNLVQTSNDYQNAAMVFQHGGDSASYKMAVELMQKAIELDSTTNKWLLAAATDRYLLSIDKPQIYGTQYQKFGEDEPWQLGEIDTTQITDAQRIEYGVETLAEQREKVKRMNKKKLSQLFSESNNVDEVISFIKASDVKESEYDISEGAINSFGYQLMAEDKNDAALEVFKLNTELYPEAFNTYDSYGECLMKMGKKEKAIEAYKKSLALNSGNSNAKKILEEAS
jgi:tetratricopeptide (TPR) repeat protein